MSCSSCGKQVYAEENCWTCGQDCRRYGQSGHFCRCGKNRCVQLHNPGGAVVQRNLYLPQNGVMTHYKKEEGFQSFGIKQTRDGKIVREEQINIYET